MRRMREVLERIERRQDQALRELHPELRRRVRAVLDELGGRMAAWEGYRDAIGQAKARANGKSNADFGDSPHNYLPPLACDLVLNPERVPVRAHKDDPDLPDLWDEGTPEAIDTWIDLERACIRHGLERVNVNGRRDLPHVQLPGWRKYIPKVLP
ncbi:MAG: hypothetical protein RL760_225 [Candidatus Eisenbacteria bacterium]